MKVYLINPPSGFLINERNNFPIGLLYLYSMLKKHNIDVSVLDLSGTSNLSLPTDGDVYGFTSTTPQFDIVCKLASSVKKNNNLIILGGVHGTILPVESLLNTSFDIVCQREGEYTLLDIVKGIPLDQIDGIVYKNHDGVIVTNKPRKQLIDIDELPFPLIEAIDYKTYTCYAFNTLENPLVKACHLSTSRGCPYGCAFCCSKAINNRKIRYHSADYIRQYVDYLKLCGYDNFVLIDDNIVANRKHLQNVCSILKEKKALWRAQIRGDLLTTELAQLMYNSGCRQLDLGVETGSQRLLNLLNKGEQVGDNGRAIQIAQSVGLKIKAYLLVGLPTENQTDIDLTIDFINTYKPNGVTLSTFIPFPGCDIAENPAKYNYEIDVTVPYSEYVGIGSKSLYESVGVKEIKENTIKFSKQLSDAIAKVSKTTNTIDNERQE